MSDPTGRRDERSDVIEAKLDKISVDQDKISVDQGDAIGTLGAGLVQVANTVTELTANLELALLAQREAEAHRIADTEQSKRRFFVTIGGILLANVVVIAISLSVLLNQQEARDVADQRSTANRDRQQCATTLMVEWDARLGEALRVQTQVPPPDPTSPVVRDAIDNLNRATRLLSDADELCYGPVPNPDPVPDR